MSVLHILVVSFHHKKGCQIEFAYPPLVSTPSTNDEPVCPSGWKYLPTLALPDGSHNFYKDTAYFNIPSLTDPQQSIYGVSCFRQIAVEKLKNIAVDVTRSTVQKSVCALLSIPIYGYVEVKLSLIADAFFEQGDFSATNILTDAYEELNAVLCNSNNPLQMHLNVGLTIRDLVLRWRSKILIIFKLLLLQKRVICFGSPVRPVCNLIMTIISLHPSVIQHGFQEVACVTTSRPMSPMPEYKDEPREVPVQRAVVESPEMTISPTASETSIPEESVRKRVDSVNGVEVTEGGKQLQREISIDTMASNLESLCSISPSTWLAPLKLFGSGNLCFPYLSLPYMDLLSDPSVKSYIIGTSNILFQQKKRLADVYIDENCEIEAQDPETRRQLQLTTEDLRFMDYIIRNVQNMKDVDGDGSEGWIRQQFQSYMLALLRTSLASDSPKEAEHFNGAFINGWKKTDAYQEWLERIRGHSNLSILESLMVGHPFNSGTHLTVNDMKLKLAQSINSSEGGRKVSQALGASSRAFGAAFSNTKAWFSSITTTSAVTLIEQQSASAKSTKNLESLNEKNLEKNEKQMLEDDDVIEISKLNINNLHDLVIVNTNGEADD